MGSLKEQFFTKKVFLGGTCNESTWRQELIELLDPEQVRYFDPVVPDWNEAAYQRELQEKRDSDFVLYTITPKMTGVYSIAEVTDDSNKRPSKTIFVVLEEDDGQKFTEGQMKSLEAVKKLILGNGGKVYNTLKECSVFLNKG